MGSYRLLFMHANRLHRWELIEADDYLSAVEQAAQRGTREVVELWSEDGKIGVFRPAGRHIVR